MDIQEKFDPDSPSISVSEDSEFIYVKAFIPTIPLKEIQMSFENGMLSIRSDKIEQKLFYQVAIPRSLDVKAIPKSSYNNGILKVVFTKNRDLFIKRKNIH